MTAEPTTVFKEHSQTYYYSTQFFDAETKDAVTRLYAFVRTADEFVDQQPQDVDGFETFRADYEEEKTDHPHIRAFNEVSHAYGFDDEWVAAFLDAMEQDLHKTSYESLDDLKTYMYGSAEVIGLMLARILGADDADEEARMLGRGMQYINFLRDIKEDNDFGRTYIPQDILDTYGLDSVAEDVAEANTDAFKAMMQAETSRGLDWLNDGRAGFDSIPGRNTIPVATAADMYAWTATKIQGDPLSVYTTKHKPSTLRVILTGVKNTVL